MRINYMDALAESSAFSEGRRSPDPEALSSPDSHPADGFTLEMSDLMLPSALESEIFGIPADSSATVVSASSSDDLDESIPPATIITTSRPSKQRKSHSLSSTSLILSQSPLGEAVTQPAPEFLCHLFAMLRDPSYADLISWSVPSEDEPDHMGGGISGIGKIVVHKPEGLQDFVLGKYYRHSKYASFQRQLNYFGFKKRLHGGKKGKLSPCSYIHETLTKDVGSLFTLKRRPPAKKRVLELGDIGSSESVASHGDSTSSKKRRLSVQGKSKKSKKDKQKQQQQRKQQVAISSMPIQVHTEEYGTPCLQRSVSIQSTQSQAQTTINTLKSETQTSQQQTTDSSSHEASQPTLLELLGTSLPPSDILFNDDFESVDDEGIPAWVTDDGKYHYHNVDSSLVDLA
eukprot:CAMPEP_0181097248 /NCGR_PEP_ID=MMETSP1071-20121207/11464_1 /TAXON_ID=35127 /ORGANISM="Thalassiosira sp., Strain NH16" /LENGTH=401 /DNA_ID=CAMNT_0023179709 /DNA_START=208 /DNA_END=1409 /DNA_ORIENTATION=-